MIAQPFLDITDGSYFGVLNPGGIPLFTWSSMPSHDFFPDFTRAIEVGNTYGINLHA